MTRDEMEFDAAVAVRYHRRRAAFLERASAVMSAIILLGGATAFVGLVGEANIFSKVLAFLIVVVGIVQIVFQTDRCAAEHRQWMRRWNEIYGEIVRCDHADQAQINEWVRIKTDIESECVAEMKALAHDCYNRTMNAQRRHGEPFKITAWQKLWMQFFSFENASYS